MGLLIWKQYAQANEIELEAPEDGDDSDEDGKIPFAEITAESVFIKEPEKQPKIENQAPVEHEDEQIGDNKVINQFYTENDSDEDSDFEIKYQQTADDFADVKKTVLPTRPLFIQDLIQGLHSDDHDRYTIAIESMEEIIRDQNNNDLEIMTDELLQSMFRASNKFEEAAFLGKKYDAIVALLVKQPRQALISVI